MMQLQPIINLQPRVLDDLDCDVLGVEHDSNFDGKKQSPSSIRSVAVRRYSIQVAVELKYAPRWTYRRGTAARCAAVAASGAGTVDAATPWTGH